MNTKVFDDLNKIKRKLRKINFPRKALSSIETRALRSGRRQTGQYTSNRKSRWKLEEGDPQYGNEQDCKIILIDLLAQLSLFEDSEIDPAIFEGYLQHERPYLDPLLLKPLNYKDFLFETLNPVHGNSNYHLGHINPKIHPKHIPGNVRWMYRKSNLIQGDMTLQEAKIELLEISERIKTNSY